LGKEVVIFSFDERKQINRSEERRRK